MKKQFALSVIILLSSIANAQKQDYFVSCNAQSLLFPKQTLSKDSKNLDVSAEHIEVADSNYILTGNAIINSSAYHLTADKINLQKNTQASQASGNIKFQNNDIMLTSDEAIIEKQGVKTQAMFEQVDFQHLKNKLSAQAQKITNDGNKQTLYSVTYELCPVGNQDWIMKTPKMTLDADANQGIAEDITIEFMGVPIFYYPYYEWQLKGRSSGFMAPMFATFDDAGSGKSGYQIRIPYYFNIAPDRDFLLTFNHVSTRGEALEGKYRQLIDNGRVEINGHYLDEDKISKKRRWYFDTKLDLSLNDTTKLDIISKRVSDKLYFNEIAHDNTSTNSLSSSVNLVYQNQEENLNAAIFAENEQLVGEKNDENDIEYTRVPEISISKKVQGLGARESNFSMISTKFKHKTKPSSATGMRTHAQATFTRNIKTNAYSLQPKLEVSKTEYAMDDDTNRDRSIYSFGVDTKLFFERDTNLFGKKIIQTLTPRLSYNYTPHKDQSKLPNFDSEEITNTYENLFSGKEYTGFDKIEKTNDITLGVESDFIDQETGQTHLTLNIAQAHYLDEKKVKEKGKNHSNIVANANLAVNKFTFNNALAYDTKANKTAKHYNALSYTSNARKFITLTHGDDGEQKSAGVYGAYPITQNTHVFADVNRSLTDSINSKKTAGLAYESCCWIMRIKRFKEITALDKFYNVTKFEFVLKPSFKL